jgi:phosphate transport system ATP-binding protein
MTGIIKIQVKDLDFYYNGDIHALRSISLGPAGVVERLRFSGASTACTIYTRKTGTGGDRLSGAEHSCSHINLNNLRSRIGMVFQKPTPFPMSFAENVAYGLRLKGIKNKRNSLTASNKRSNTLRSGKKSVIN